MSNLSTNRRRAAAAILLGLTVLGWPGAAEAIEPVDNPIIVGIEPVDDPLAWPPFVVGGSPFGPR